jgi:hypothetical protein
MVLTVRRPVVGWGTSQRERIGIYATCACAHVSKPQILLTHGGATSALPSRWSSWTNARAAASFDASHHDVEDLSTVLLLDEGERRRAVATREWEQRLAAPPGCRIRPDRHCA